MAKYMLATLVVLVGLIGSVHMQGTQYQNQSPTMQPLQNNDFLSTIFRGNGLTDTLSQIPARGIEMIGSVLNNVRNLLPGLGRNGSMPAGSNQMMNQYTPGNLMNQLNQNGLSDLAKPFTDALDERRLPDATQVTEGLSRTMNRMSNNLPKTFRDMVPQSNQGGNSNSLSSLLGNLSPQQQQRQ